jgi:hypothetical protein
MHAFSYYPPYSSITHDHAGNEDKERQQKLGGGGEVRGSIGGDVGGGTKAAAWPPHAKGERSNCVLLLLLLQLLLLLLLLLLLPSARATIDKLRSLVAGIGRTHVDAQVLAAAAHDEDGQGRQKDGADDRADPVGVEGWGWGCVDGWGWGGGMGFEGVSVDADDV